jgi:hypothetical protein
MEQLLNADGTPSFTNISNLRTNFEESFARKQLGATMKSIVIKSINHIENNNASEVLSDEKIRGIVKGSIEDVADRCFTNDELNGSSYIGGLKKIVKEYAGMEADYREDLANAILATESDKAVAGGKIHELFSTENLKFTNRTLFKRFSDELESTFAMEGEEIVTEIGKEVGAAIAEAEEKNVIINETSKVIQDKQDEIREELSTTDEDDDEDDETSSDEGSDGEFDDSEDDGEEPENDEVNTDDTSTEGFENGLETSEDNIRIRNEAIKIIESKKGEITSNILETYKKIINNETKVSNKVLDAHWKNYYKDENEFKVHMLKQFDIGLSKLKGKNRVTFNIPFARVTGPNKARRIFEILFTFIGGWLTWPIALVLWITDEKAKNRRILTKAAKKEITDYASIKVVGKCTGSNSDTFDTILSFKIKFKAKKIVEYGGLEDFDAEVSVIEENLDTSLISDIENGKISIGIPDTSHTEDTETTPNVDITDVSEHDEDGAVGNEEPDQVPTDLTVSEPNDNPEPETNETVSVEGYDSKEYLDYKFGNENLGKVIVPLSPTKLDMIDIPKTNSLASVYAKGSESLDSLKSVVTARLDMLEDIVSREHDEELSKKFEDYKKCAVESFDGAAEIQNAMNAIGITPYGIINKEDSTSLYIGSKARRYLSHELPVKNKNPKKSFESLTDAIDAAFDIAILKDSARNAKTKEDLIALNKERASREDLFWSNLLGFDGDEEKKDQIKNILQFADLNIDSKALVDNEYLKSLKIALDTQKVPVPGKSEDEIHEELFNNSKERIESFLGKDLHANQLDIIRAMIEGRDTSDYAPTPFEKFIIKLGTDEALEKNGGKDFEVGQESAELIKNKAIILTALNAFVDKTNPMNDHDTKEFKEYIGL